ncbi:MULTISPECIES: hypothetical protein [Methylobacterium]|jgi:hypothetical protein|uniref:hypothetical protein n=1 Tax=Methylobacterium TaxID=407 RepID=UPI0011CA1A83|nr:MULTISPECIES: hypothetical protein [Methylobacterium]TXN39920.1 hypothetical protein FV233_27420 [Methylobacterium sp. WL7]GJE23912.1 hypothetical protein JHFBIEKO_4376 [Methylobacterium mesophilicum]
MTKRREAGRTTPHADTLPEQAAVERAIEAVLDRLRPKPAKGPASRAPQAGPARKPGPGRKAD